MRFYIKRKILTGVIVSIVIFFSLGVASYTYVQKVVSVSKWTSHAYEVLFHSEHIRSTLLLLETIRLQHNFTGDKIFTEKHSKAIHQLSGHLKELSILTADNRSQQERINNLQKAVDGMIWLPDESLKKETGNKGRQQLNTGVSSMDVIADIIDKIQHEETRLINEREATAMREFYRFTLMFGGLHISGLIILLILTYMLNVNIESQSKAEEKLKHTSEAMQDLYDNAPCGYFSLDKTGLIITINQTLLKWIGYRKEEVVNTLHISTVLPECVPSFYDNDFAILKINGYKNDIDCHMLCKNKSIVNVMLSASVVMDRQGNLAGVRCSLFDNTERKRAQEETKLLNQELEAFAYSVSHDLRAPLRSINGYTQILKDDFSEKVDAEGKRVINVIVNNAKKMGQLIDDLLNFSRTGRKEIVKATVNMTDYVEPILNELVASEKKRQIKVDMQPLGTSTVDVNLIRQVWTNLLSNAIKYTRKKEIAHITIGSYDNPDETVYYVKDNGVGFDMQYVGKLFGVFQRLHKPEDFEGTGVGLALSKRIIDRHKGRIWAVAKENGGAEFYFSIPK